MSQGAGPVTATVAVIGAGPAGLMAAEVLAAAGVPVTVYDAMPSAGRKFLMAGKGGMNITHAEPWSAFVARYGLQRACLTPHLSAFGPDQIREWMAGLGIASFVGTSGRVFPREMKAAPLLRAWLQRLRGAGVRFHMRRRWLGWDADGALLLAGPDGTQRLAAGCTILALGGGSWARLGSDGAWVPLLQVRGVAVTPLRPANCGFDVAWSAPFRQRHEGAAVKSVVARFAGHSQPGEFNVTAQGVEGGLIYAFAAALRAAIDADGPTALTVDLAPGRSLERLAADLARPRGRDSLANHLRRRAGIEGVKAGLLREFMKPEMATDGMQLAHRIKNLPLRLEAPRPLDEAISTAGGVAWAALDEHLMLRQVPGVFCAGEMLDWEAPTGGYLLTACLATGHAAGRGALAWLGLA